MREPAPVTPTTASKVARLATTAIRQIRRVRNLRSLRLAAQLLLVSGCIVYLAHQLRNIGRLSFDWQISYSLLAAVGGLTTLSVFLGAAAWWSTLRGFGLQVSWEDGARTHLISNLAKYLPGFGWHLMGKAYLTRRMGVSARLVALSMLTEMALIAAIGIGIAFSLTPVSFAMRWAEPEILSGVLSAVRVGGVLLLGACLTIMPLALRSKWARQHVGNCVPHMFARAAVAVLVGWLLFGLAFWLLGSAFAPRPLSEIPVFTFALTISFLVGLAVVFVPGGIGVREVILVFILGPYVSGPVAVLYAIVLRLVVVGSEILAAVGMEVWTRKIFGAEYGHS